MLNAKSAAAVLPATDLDRARQYYEDKLGWKPDGQDAGGLMYTVGGTSVYLYETTFAGTAQNTALMVEVADLESSVAELRAAGVAFADYDLPGLRTVDGIADLDGEKAAWFTDSEGNIIALGQRSG
ncbi:VOC family protein [Leifsonia sp. YIM 134122]|uniref:VOC family protein n=1 Tax=Leifsonia stereocauli TaxID=3134136 RepID=A0ABU9W4A1_9MICO